MGLKDYFVFEDYDLYPFSLINPSESIRQGIYSFEEFLHEKLELINFYEKQKPQKKISLPANLVASEENWQMIKNQLSTFSDTGFNIDAGTNWNLLTHSFDITKYLLNILPEHLKLFIEKNREELVEIAPDVFTFHGHPFSEAMLNKLDFDTRKGCIVIGSDVEIQAFSHLTGPLWIGDYTTIKSNSQIRESSIGRQVKVGGEVSQSVINDYSNKSHFGFLGNSVVGRWVNLAAGTTTSNLKNNYLPIKTINAAGEVVDSGMSFLGAIIGDYCKTSIETEFYPGVIIEPAVLVAGRIMGCLKTFHSYDGSETKKLDFDKFISSLSIMYERRNLKLENNSNEWNKLENIFNNK